MVTPEELESIHKTYRNPLEEIERYIDEQLRRGQLRILPTRGGWLRDDVRVVHAKYVAAGLKVDLYPVRDVVMQFHLPGGDDETKP